MDNWTYGHPKIQENVIFRVASLININKFICKKEKNTKIQSKVLQFEILVRPSYLDCPVDENVGSDLAAAEDPVESPATGILHHQGQVGLLQAHTQQADNILVK